ncbi:MAG: OmpA family protein [Vicinamibacteria bacterium]|nr:OmpA family protein [Vicinamibacteria bacterium]
MRLNHKLAVLAALVLAGAACHKEKPVVPPFVPKATPTPAVVPANPTPAPTPRDVPIPEKDRRTILLGTPIDELDKMGLLGDVYFDFDKADLRENDRGTLTRNGETLKELDFLIVTIEGHADERGTIEYNLALSDRRARLAYDYLISIGIAPNRIKAVAYGKEIPVCSESNEDCWQRNRRAHFAITGKTAAR